MIARLAGPLGAAALAVLLHGSLPLPAAATQMTQDTDGFQGLNWGRPLGDVPGLVQVASDERTVEFEPRQNVPTFGEAKVESIRYVMMDGQFARVTVRYQGAANHEAMLAFLQAQYGHIDRTPGQMMRGLNQQYYWRGPNSQISVTYNGRSERGHVFVESLDLAPKFNEGISETAY
jgi:hypothetical protein